MRHRIKIIRKIIKVMVYGVLLVNLITGCHSTLLTEPTMALPTSKIGTITPTLTISPTMTITPFHHTAQIPTPAFISTDTPEIIFTATPNIVLRNCLIIKKDELFEEIFHTSVAVLKSQKGDYYLYNFETRKQYPLPHVPSTTGTDLNSFMVSPDGYKLYYSDSLSSPGLFEWIVTSTGKIISSFSSKDNWILNGWVNDSTLEYNVDYGKSPQTAGTMAFMDVTRGATWVIPPSFPDSYYRKDFSWWSAWLARYNSDMDRVIYLTNNFDVALWDTTHNKVLWERNEPGYIREITFVPRWSPEGDHVAVWDNLRVDIIDRFGNETPMPDITGLKSYKPSQNYGVYGFFWSPDGKTLGLWIGTGKMGGEFVFLDTQTNKLTDYCIDASYEDDPVWSPDSQQVYIPALEEYGNDQWRSAPLLLDISKGIIYQVPDSPKLVAWMK